MTLRPHHLPPLHHVHRTLVYGAVGLVPEPVLVALGRDAARGARDGTGRDGQRDRECLLAEAAKRRVYRLLCRGRIGAGAESEENK